MADLFDSSTEYIKKFLPPGWTPEIGIICGSGLGGLVDCLQPLKETKQLVQLPYQEIPNFPQSTGTLNIIIKVHGHKGILAFGLLGGKKIVCMVGRFHFYEGHDLVKVTFPIRVMKRLGVTILIVTNASGSLDQEHCQLGDIMMIRDHLNLPGMAGHHPLRGQNLESFGCRFPAMSDAYDLELRQILRKAFEKVKEGVPNPPVLREGVYAFVSGPAYETPAEASFLKSIGGHVVGMSSVPEVIVARHCGIRVLGLSLITNYVLLPQHISDSGKHLIEKANHEEVLKMSQQRAQFMQTLVQELISILSVL